MLNKITKRIFYFFSFLLPLAFLPLAGFVDYFDKKLFLSIFVFSLFGLWTTKSFIAGQLRYPAGKTAKAVLSLALVFFASAALSGIFGQSFFGSPAQADSFFNFGLAFLMFFLAAAILEDEKEVFNSIKLFAGGASVLASVFLILGTLALNGQRLLVFGAGDTAQILALVLGSGFVALISVLSLGDGKLLDIKNQKARRGISVLAGTLLLGGICFIDFQLAWFLIILASIIILCRLLAVPASKASRLTILAIFAGALFLFFFGSPFKSNFDYPNLPNSNLSLKIAQATLTESPKNFFLGSGLATFPYQFSLHNNGAFNQTKFSGFVFDQGAFGFLTLLVEAGILGGLALIALIGFFFWQGFKILTSQEESEKAIAVSFVSAFYLILLFFFFWINFGLVILAFWALGIFAAAEKQKEIVFAEKFGLKKIIAVILILFGLIISVFGVYVSVQRYMANASLRQTSLIYNQGKLDEAVGQAQQTVSIWQQDDYYVLLSTLYLKQADFFLKDRKNIAQNPLSEEEKAGLKKLADQAVAAADYACRLDPKNYSNWQNLGSIYANLIFVADNAGQEALSAYDKAEKLYPQSLGVILGRAFIYEAKGEKDKAIAEYQKYLDLIEPDSQDKGTVKNKIEQLSQNFFPTDLNLTSGSENNTAPGDVTIPTSTAPTSSEEKE